MFWNEDCKNLVKELWIPPLEINPVVPKRKFKCDHKEITFKYYSSSQKINPIFEFVELPVNDNTNQKIKLYDSLMGKEMKRLQKETTNPKCKLPYDKLESKHVNFVEKIEEKVNNLDKLIRSYRVQILPNNRQAHFIQTWIHDTIHVYNRLAIHFTQIYQKIKEKVSLMRIDQPNKIKTIIKLLRSNKEFPLNFYKLRELKQESFCHDYCYTPYCIIADVIKEFLANVKGNITKLSKGDIPDFIMKPKKLNADHHAITLESHYTTKDGFYPSTMGKIKTNDKEFEWAQIKHDYKLIYDFYTKKYYVHVPKYVFKKDLTKRNPIAVMDPGARKFQTLYGLNHIIKIGENLGKPISKRLLKIDKLDEKIATKGKKYNKKLKKYTRKKNHKLKKARSRHHTKIAHLQAELHHKVGNYLCENYDRIMVTTFSSKKVSSKKKNLLKMTKRVLGKLSHYKFKQRLQHKCEKYGCLYLEKSEAYTSKTCCQCGNMKEDLGTAELYACTSCKCLMDRDVNGAINILLKNREALFNL